MCLLSFNIPNYLLKILEVLFHPQVIQVNNFQAHILHLCKLIFKKYKSKPHLASNQH